MKKPLRVLIIEDAERDALLLARQLRLGGYDPAMTRVENAAELSAALTAAGWDIVFCDYRMPGFDGLAALKLVQAHQCDAPFILVSGVIGEDQAVATMKAGAHDFILKDKLARLVPAVDRELREAEMRRRRRQAEEELQYHLRQLRWLVDASLQVLTAGSQTEVLQRVADAAASLASARLSTTSYRNQNGATQFVAAARAPNVPPCPPGNMFCNLQGGVFLDLLGKTPVLRLNDAELRAHPAWWGLPEGHVSLRGLLGVRLVAANGQANGLILVSDKSSGDDFTAADESWLQQLATLASLALQRLDARDRAEQNAAVTRQLTESLPQLVWSCDPSGACDYLSRQWLDYTGIDHTRRLGFDWLDQLHPEDHPQAVARWAEAVKASTIFDLELRIRGADGAFHWFKSRSVPIRDADGKTVRWYGTNTDIEDLKRAEAALQTAHDELETRVRERTAELITANAALQRVNRALKTLSECNQVLVSATTELDLLQRICQLLVTTGGYSAAWVGFAELDHRKPVRPVAQAGLVNGHLEKLTASWADAGQDDSPADIAMRTRRHCLHLTELSKIGALTGPAATLALPLQTSDQSIGVLMILASSAEAFDADAIELLTKLANDLAFGLVALRTRLERDHAAQALKKWAQLFQRAHWGVAVASADGNILEMLNPAYASMHGCTEADLTGAPILNVYAPESRAEVAEQVRLAHEKERAIFESRHLRKDGTTFPALVDMSAVRNERGQIVYWVIYTQDISELKSLEARILDISEQEQQRIGQDLHDSLCQQLSGIAYLCHSTRERIACVAPQEAGALNRISELLQEANDQARGLARGLQPVENEVNGLVVALQGMVGSFQHIYRVSARFLCAKPEVILDNAVATHLYRIVQEAMSNAVKHGRASQIVVRLSETNDTLTLSVKDNGCGFPAELPKSRGLGLETMRFRARAIGAELDIERGDKGGTQLTCTLRKRNHPETIKASND